MKKTQKRQGNGFKGPSPDVGKATQFKPGNPGGPGRPRSARFSDAAKELAAEVRKVGKREVSGAEELAKVCFNRAVRGSVRHAELFLAYAEGKPKQGVELSGPDGAAIRFANLSDAEADARVKELWAKFTETKHAKPGRKN